MTPIPLTYSHDPQRHPAHWPVTRGVPMPVGTLRETDGLAVVDPDGERVPARFRVLGRWADGSVKWVLVDFQAKGGSSDTANYSLMDESVDGAPAPLRPATYHSTTYHSVRVEETKHDLHVDTGVLRFGVDRHRYGLFHSVVLGDGQLGDGQRGEPAARNAARTGSVPAMRGPRSGKAIRTGGWYAGYTDRGACAGHHWPATPMAFPLKSAVRCAR